MTAHHHAQRADLAVQDWSVKRRRVGLGQSLRNAIDAPAGDASGGLVSIAVGVWYWLVGQLIPDEDDNGSGAE